MERKGYSSIEDFRGKLKPYSKKIVMKKKESIRVEKGTKMDKKFGMLEVLGIFFVLVSVLWIVWYWG